MSRLDKFIVRLTVQRLLLDLAAAELNQAGAPAGAVIELGLGNGRTFHHLREKLIDRRIVAFDRKLTANPRSHPTGDDLVLGDIRETATAFAERHGASAVLLHADLGDGTEQGDGELRRWLPAVIVAMVRPGARVLTSTDLTHANLVAEPYPSEAPRYDYFIYRRR